MYRKQNSLPSSFPSSGCSQWTCSPFVLGQVLAWKHKMNSGAQYLHSLFSCQDKCQPHTGREKELAFPKMTFNCVYPFHLQSSLKCSIYQWLYTAPWLSVILQCCTLFPLWNPLYASHFNVQGLLWHSTFHRISSFFSSEITSIRECKAALSTVS